MQLFCRQRGLSQGFVRLLGMARWLHYDLFRGRLHGRRGRPGREQPRGRSLDVQNERQFFRSENTSMLRDRGFDWLNGYHCAEADCV